MTLEIRPAQSGDAGQMCDLLNRIIAVGGTTAHRTPFDNNRMHNHFIAHPLRISCMLAEAQDRIVGFQALEWADPEYDGPDSLPADWAVIATFVAEGQQGQGIGRKLFAATLDAATSAGVTAIDATIRRENSGGLTYYSAMGFVDYRSTKLALSKRYDL